LQPDSRGLELLAQDGVYEIPESPVRLGLWISDNCFITEWLSRHSKNS